jgi:class 3 adenylate cyclase/CHASE2 domain-containing sensor protein
VKLKPVKLAPALIAACVIVLVCVVRLIQPDFFERMELATYDMRVREAVKFPAPASTNLGFVFMDDASVDFVRTNQSLGYRFGLLWPRQVYGRLVEELSAQAAKAVAFDVIFGELREDQSPVQMADGRLIESDDFLGMQMRRAGNIIIASTKSLNPPLMFATNALALGDISTTVKSDSSERDRNVEGVLRRAKAFRLNPKWHWAFRQTEANPELGIDLSRARIEINQVVLIRSDGSEIKVPLDAEGNFDLTDFGGDKLPPGVPRKAKPITDERIWHMGIVLAAQELGLDLAKAEVNLNEEKIILRGTNGVERIIPVDDQGRFYIDWSMTPTDPRLAKEPIQKLLQQDTWRLEGTNGLPNRWAGKLVVVGSSATGNNLTDRGATPLESDTLLASEHWNVANSIITGRFIRRSSLELDLLMIVALGVVAALLTWQLRALIASLSVAVLVAGYVALGVFLYGQYRYWLPLVLPLLGAVITTHVCLVVWRVVFEQAERRRVKSIFSKIVSPDIVNELLGAEKLSLGGARREVTVLFADVRGFTEFTDKNQEQAAAYVAANKLTGEAMETYFDEQAREALSTVNTYLAVVADMVKKHVGTLDKYIGDCVMAFWGAPTANSKHAADCVRAAIDAQRAIYELNRQRADQNKNLELENLARASAGLPPKMPNPILLLGSGINTGLATVGLMGSEAHISNYTVFGREVNLASRLETVSGRGRIVISEATYEHLLRDDPALAATCVALAAEKVKGIRMAVKVYEVPWRPPGSISLDEEFFPQRAAEKSPETILTQREKT